MQKSWFFGLKQHLIVNNKGEILSFIFTTGMWMTYKQLKLKMMNEEHRGD